MKKHMLRAIVVSMGVVVSLASFGQQKEPPKRVVADTPAFVNLSAEQAMARAESKLKKVEAAMKKVKDTKTVTAEDTDAFREDLTDYGQSLMAASEKAHGAVQAADTSKSNKGGIKLVADFEQMAKDHEARMTKVKADGDSIKELMRQGKIKPSRSFLDRVKGSERQKFKDFLAPEAKKDIETISPGYFDAPPGMSAIDFRKAPLVARSAARGLMAFASKWPELIEPEAQGTAWAPCLGPCYFNPDPANCTVCSANAAWQTYNAWRDYQVCMSWVDWWNSWWLPQVCSAVFVAWVA